MAIAKTALMRAGMGQSPKPPKSNNAKIHSRSNSSKRINLSQQFLYLEGFYNVFFLLLESASNNFDLVKPKLNSASIERITSGENQSSSTTTDKYFSTSLKEPSNACNVSSNSSTAPDIGENSITITSVTCKKEMQVGRPTPTSNSISGEFISCNLYYYCLSK